MACSVNLGYPHRSRPCPPPPFDRESRNPRRVSRFGSPLENRENSPMLSANQVGGGGGGREGGREGLETVCETDAKPIGVSNRVATDVGPFSVTFSQRAISTLVGSRHSFPRGAHAINSSFFSVVPRRLAISYPFFLYRLLIILLYRIASSLDVYSFRCHFVAVARLTKEKSVWT